MVMHRASWGDESRNVISRAPFLFLRVVLAVLWIYEASRGTPWTLPAAIVGAMLLIGLLTPIAALGGAAITGFVLAHAGSTDAWGTWLWIYWLVIVLHGVVTVTEPGRLYGLDAFLYSERPDLPIW